MARYERICDVAKAISKKSGGFAPLLGLALGSGLGDFADVGIDDKIIVPYNEIKGFPVSTVAGHAGRFVFGTVGGVPVVAMQGRVHHYEGYGMDDVVLPTRVMGLLGAKALLLTNAAGGVSFDFKAGDLMLITDHIASFVKNPLIGGNINELGERFPDMSQTYDRELSDEIRKGARALQLDLKEGVYLQLTGPSYETPAEIRMCRSLGADAVGMSTAVEAIAAHHMGMRVCGISCISNLACGMSETPLSHQEVFETATRVSGDFKRLLSESIRRIGELMA